MTDPTHLPADHAPPAQGGAPAGRGGIDAVLFGPHGLRAGWRILLFSLLVWVFALVLYALLSVLVAPLAGDARAGMVVQVLVMLLSSILAGWVMLATVDRRPIGALG